MNTYPAFIVDAFTEEPYSGNAAGVVLLGRDGFPDDNSCVALAAELKHSETAFVQTVSDSEFRVKYYTPVCEAALCGHATVAAFSAMRERAGLSLGDKLVHTAAGDITVTVEADAVWLDMAEARLIRYLDREECERLYAAYGLRYDPSLALSPAIVSVGLADIITPVGSETALAEARQDEAEIASLSRELGVTGVHMFCLGRKGVTACCRNFAPLYGISEECATGTANGGLYKYLVENRVILDGSPAAFLQGEAMGRPSVVRARSERGRVRVGGNGSIVLAGEIRL